MRLKKVAKVTDRRLVWNGLLAQIDARMPPQRRGLMMRIFQTSIGKVEPMTSRPKVNPETRSQSPSSHKSAILTRSNVVPNLAVCYVVAFPLFCGRDKPGLSNLDSVTHSKVTPSIVV